MKTGINPKVDCVFKAIFGSEENKDVLIHLLNAVLDPEPEHLITTVEILNPYNDKSFDGGKTSIVDIKAKDQLERSFQIEIQILTHSSIQERMLWTWADIYHRQLNAGENYKLLKPTISIWFMDQSIFEVKDQYHHSFSVMERTRKEVLTDHFNLHVIEMKKWTDSLKDRKSIDLWLKFLNYRHRKTA